MMQFTPVNALWRVGVAALACVASGCSLQVDNQSESAVTVHGETTLRRPAEVFVIDGVIRARDADRDTALAQVTETLRTMRDTINTLRGLEALTFVTETLSVNTVRPTGCEERSARSDQPDDCNPIAFDVTIPFHMRGGPPQVAGDAASLLAEQGAESVRVRGFNVSDPEAMQADARRQAVLEALQIAEDLAANSGAQLGSVISIQYGPERPLPRFTLHSMDQAPEQVSGVGLRTSPRASIRLTPDDIEITERVTVVFELQDQG